jgi:hypothetical protein
MKQKYLILKDEAKKALIIKEFAELDKEIFSLLCEQTYQDKDINAAIKDGMEALIATLRTPNMYPIERYAVQIAEEVIDLYKSKEADSKEADSKEADSKEVFFDDRDILIEDREAPELLDDDSSEAVEIDGLLEDDSTDTTIEDEIKDITKPIQIADDDSADIEDED